MVIIINKEIKNDYKSFLVSYIKNNELEDQINILNEIKNNSFEIINEILNEKTKNKVYCKECKKYFNSNNIFYEEKTIKDVLTSADAGYGDNDEYGDITWLFSYYMCNKCNNKIFKDKQYLYTENTHTRLR